MAGLFLHETGHLWGKWWMRFSHMCAGGIHNGECFDKKYGSPKSLSIMAPDIATAIKVESSRTGKTIKAPSTSRTRQNDFSEIKPHDPPSDIKSGLTITARPINNATTGRGFISQDLAQRTALHASGNPSSKGDTLQTTTSSDVPSYAPKVQESAPNTHGIRSMKQKSHK